MLWAAGAKHVSRSALVRIEYGDHFSELELKTQTLPEQLAAPDGWILSVAG